MQPVSITAATAISGTLTIANAYCASPDGNGDCAGSNNGNLWRESITPPGASTAFVQKFAYDSLNRLAVAADFAVQAQRPVRTSFRKLPGQHWFPKWLSLRQPVQPELSSAPAWFRLATELARILLPWRGQCWLGTCLV